MKATMNVSRVFALLSAFVLAVVAAPLPAAEEGESALFMFNSLEFPGTRHSRAIVDVNGDGLLDINMVFSRSDVTDAYWLRTCLQEEGRGFAGECSVIKLPPEARAFDAGDVTGGPEAELVILTPGGAMVSGFKRGSFGDFRRFPGVETILEDTEQAEPVRLRFIWNTDGKGKSEMILPSIPGPVIYEMGPESFIERQKIKSPARVTYRVGSIGDIMNTDDINQFLLFRDYQQRTSAKFTCPDAFLEDFNGDGRTDLVTLINNTLRVFFQGKDGMFSNTPDLTVKRSILPPEEKSMSFSGEAMTFADLNGDGKGDIIMVKWGTSEERTQIDRYIYYAGPNLEYNEEPDQIVRSESAAVDFGIYDLNRDGRLDLVIPFFHFAPAQAFKIMTENAIKIQFRIFLMRPDGRYGQDSGKTFAKVDRRILLNYRIDVLGIIMDFRTLLEGKFRALINFGEDINGDGFPDLVADTGNDKLEFYWGGKEVEFGRKPDLTVNYESAMDFDLLDVNGDDRADVITYYESEERTKKKRELAMKARQQGEPVSEAGEEAALVAAPEGTRIKALITK